MVTKAQSKVTKHGDKNLAWVKGIGQDFSFFYDSPNIRFILFEYKVYKTSAKAVYHNPQALSSLGRTIPASKQNAHRGVMSDEEEERMVCIEALRGHCTAEHHDSTSSSSSLRSLLIDFHKRFVNHFRQDQVVGWGHACQAGAWRRFLISMTSVLTSTSQNPFRKKPPTREVAHGHIEGLHHAHLDQDVLHVKLLLQLEAGQAHLHLDDVHHVWARPLHEVVIGQQLLQLRVDMNQSTFSSAVMFYRTFEGPTFSRPVALSSI